MKEDEKEREEAKKREREEEREEEDDKYARKAFDLDPRSGVLRMLREMEMRTRKTRKTTAARRQKLMERV